MSQFKNPLLRYRIIDRELRRWESVSSARLEKIIGNELGTNISRKTIQNDLRDMAHDTLLNFNAPIVYDKKKKTYSYSDRSYSILSFGLREEEITAMKFYTACLNLYSEYSIFKSFASAITKIVEGVNVRNRFGDNSIAERIIQTDTIPNVKVQNSFHP